MQPLQMSVSWESVKSVDVGQAGVGHLQTNGMTKYRVDRIDRIITGAYAGPLAKRQCAMR